MLNMEVGPGINAKIKATLCVPSRKYVLEGNLLIVSRVGLRTQCRHTASLKGT